VKCDVISGMVFYKSMSKKAPTFMEEMNCELYIYISLMRII